MRKGAAAALASSTKSFQLSGLSSGLPDHALHFFVVDVAVKAAHAVAFDEGDHVVFEAGQIVGGGDIYWAHGDA